MEKSPKNYFVTLFLCFFLGTLGIHRFYTKKVGSGIFFLLTLGGLYIWQIIDLALILIGKFRDKQGRSIRLHS